MSHTVWIIDDDNSIRWVLEKALARADILCESYASADLMLQRLEYDLLASLTAPVRPDVGVLVVGLDEPSLAALNMSPPLPRRLHAQLVDAVRTLRVGRPLDPSAVVGPLIERASGKLLDALTVLGDGEQWLIEPRALDATGEQGAADKQPGQVSRQHHSKRIGARAHELHDRLRPDHFVTQGHAAGNGIQHQRQRCRDAKVVSQAMVIASPNLGARHWPTLAKSKLYDASFTHRFRKASVPAAPTETS